jgi:hypothetical protein
MPNKGRIADYLHTWGKMVKNLHTNATGLPDLSANRDALERVLEAVKDRTAQVAARKGIKQEEVKAQRELLRQGRFEFSRLRSLIIGYLGAYSERLTDFGINPLRPRKRSSEKGQPKPKPEQPQPEEAKPSKAEAVKPEQPQAKEPKPENPAPAPEVKPAPQGS